MRGWPSESFAVVNRPRPECPDNTSYAHCMPRLHRLVQALAGAVVVLLFAVGCGGSSDTAVEAASSATTSEASADEGSAPVAEAALVASTVDGGQIDFASLEGQDVVLWFWAPW